MSLELVSGDAEYHGGDVLLWCLVIKVTSEKVIHEKQSGSHLQFGPKSKVRGRGSR